MKLRKQRNKKKKEKRKSRLVPERQGWKQKLSYWNKWFGGDRYSHPESLFNGRMFPGEEVG
jgi:hypothetical protein